MIILVNQQIRIFKKLSKNTRKEINMNNLTFNDIAMPVSFYEETGVWGYIVNPDHKDFDAIRQALKANPDEEYFSFILKTSSSHISMKFIPIMSSIMIKPLHFQTRKKNS